MVNTRREAQRHDCQIGGKVPCREMQLPQPVEKPADRCLLIRQSRIKVNADEITHFSEKPGDLLESAIQIEG
jgi:hypothetical protein